MAELTVDEKVLREEDGCVRGCEVVGIRCTGWKGMGWDGIGWAEGGRLQSRTWGKRAAADAVSGGHNGVGSSSARSPSPLSPETV
jgi:hypothetical protein